jgi:hypothetical protein
LISNIRAFLEYQTKFKDRKDIEKRILQEHEKLKEEPEKAKNAKLVAREIKNWIFECVHPIAKKTFDWAHIKYGPNLENFIAELLVKGIKSSVDIKELDKLLKEFREEIKRNIERVTKDVESGIRPFHAPGSVAYKEARNLYFGEKYESEALSQMSTHLLNSFYIGRDVGVYLACEELRKDIDDILSKRFGVVGIPPEDLERELRIHNLERNKPYILFISFLIFLYETWEKETNAKEKEKFTRILSILKETEGVIYFTPSKDKAKYSTMPIPRLDFFFSRWLESEKERKILLKMKEEFYVFIRDVMINAKRIREERVAQNSLELFVTYYDMVCAELLRSSLISHELLRRIADLVIELSERYNVDTRLSFIRELTTE